MPDIKDKMQALMREAKRREKENRKKSIIERQDDLYMISYDLHNEKDYDGITNELKQLGAKSLLDSHWALRKRNTTAEELFDRLNKLIDSDDTLLVTTATDCVGIRLATKLDTL